MIREVDIDTISDGKRYTSNDMVKIGCNECNGCSECCHGMGESIVLDPYDLFNLIKATKLSAENLLKESLELNVVQGVILPNIRMQKETKGCIFLNEGQRCSIHEYRPGFCRLFPLGRIYEGDGFSYFHQINECKYPNKSKVKIKKWLGIQDLSTYEKYISDYHFLINKMSTALLEDSSEDTANKVNTLFLKLFFLDEYDIQKEFYSQFYLRYNKFMQLF